MRQGRTPQEACEEAIGRIVNKPNSDYKNFQVGYIAMNKQGVIGIYSIHKDFSMTKYQEDVNKQIQSDYFNKV
jgi:N4-(beta-N-acetylglucosaminyl)-L-asparaginase